MLDAYLFRARKYKIIPYTQHKAVKRKFADILFEAVYDSGTGEDQGPENMEAIIESGLSELPERCQIAVRLKLKESLSNGDIAKRMIIKVRTVQNYIVSPQ